MEYSRVYHLNFKRIHDIIKLNNKYKNKRMQKIITNCFYFLNNIYIPNSIMNTINIGIYL